MAQITSQEAQMFARLSQDRQFIEWLKARADARLHTLAACTRENFEQMQGRYLEDSELLTLVTTGQQLLAKFQTPPVNHGSLDPKNFR